MGYPRIMPANCYKSLKHKKQQQQQPQQQNQQSKHQKILLYHHHVYLSIVLFLIAVHTASATSSLAQPQFQTQTQTSTSPQPQSHSHSHSVVPVGENFLNSKTLATRHKSKQTQRVQHFRAPRRNDSAPYVEKQLVFVALLPEHEADSRNDCIKPKVLPALELAITHVQRLGFPHAYIDVTLISRDSFCSSIYGPIGFFEISTQWPELHAVFGLPCEYVLAPISRYAGVWEIPVFTSGGNAAEFVKKAESYPTLTRLKGAQVNNLGNVARAIIESFNWTRTALIYQNEDRTVKGNSVCFFCISAVHDKLQEMSVFQQAFDTGTWSKQSIAKMLSIISKQTRIVIMCADPQSIRQIMLTAEELKMIDNGEYVFINIELFSRVPHLTSQPWYDKNDTAENNDRARKAYTAMLTVTPKQPNDDEYTRVSNEIKSIAAAKYNYTFHDNESISAFVTSFFDGVLLYASALNDSIRDDPTMLTRPINGTDMVRRMWNRSFTGITGNVTIDANGDRISAYSLLDMNPTTGRFEIVAHFLHNRLEYVPGKVIHWSGNRLEPPPDRPVCGYDGSLCPDNSLPGYAILSIVLGVVVLVMNVCFIVGYRHYKSEADINSMAWKVSIDEVILHDSLDRCIRGSFHSLVRYNSQQTLMSEDMGSFCADRQIFIPVGMFRGCKVAIKSIDEGNVNLTRSLMLELKRMKDLQHDHLVKFYGACLDPSRSFLLTEYCPKGSLQDILENEQFQLDWMFKLSLMHDIVRGMQFLHSSDIKSHGNLKSSNCVVDSRFVLKITDFGLHSLRKTQPNKGSDVENCNSHAYWSKLLWTAPELLRMENNRPPEGTQKGDVYSFGIIVHEITTRQGPFYLGNGQPEKSPQEIIQLVMAHQPSGCSPFRPQIDSTDTCIDIINLMTKCWAEDPSDRPDFNALKTIIRKINKDNETGNIVDNLLKRMEQYANNLEELVEERTQDYIEEKKKCEKLLYQLLPQSVAAQLISGQPVVAETFEEVTIYFSDIVGFTAISAESTPMQVVQFLNDLYTCFDSIVENFDVYKVETIGDAYMVVSGLPIRNGNQHAREIARLALALLDAVHNFVIHHRPNDRLKLRIGLHTGACVAGVVGLKMPRYCLFGDTVNTASRMESNGEALKIHISEKTKLALDEFGTFITTRRGYVPMKGKGEMLTYWLEGEVEKEGSPISPRMYPFTRRQCVLQKQDSEMAPYPMIYQIQPPSLTEPKVRSNQNSPNLRVKRKISSSSPKLNGNDYKTDDIPFYVDPPLTVVSQAANSRSPAVASAPKCSNQLKLRDSGASEIHSHRSLRDGKKDTWELANFRLPLSGALKSHGQLKQSNSNSNLSGVLQPAAARLRLKHSPTISTLVTNERTDLIDGSSINGGGNRYRISINPNINTAAENTTTTTANAINTNPSNANASLFKDIYINDENGDVNVKVEDEIPPPPQHLAMNHHQSLGSGQSSNCKTPLLENTANSDNSAETNLSNSCNNYNHIVKANNVKNFKILCKNSSNSIANDHATVSSGGAAGTVTQPLLAKINS